MLRLDLDNKADADNWHAVQDRRERKRVQDRLAQRARRKRLAEIKKSQSEHDNVNRDTENDDAGTLALTLPTSDCSRSLSRGAESPILYPSPDTSMIPVGVRIPKPERGEAGFQSEIPMNVWTAMYINGSMMGLGCSTSYPVKSKPMDSSIPDSLQPTPLQLITIHPQWIDRFPFPRMRDNLINAISLVDEEEFMHDLFCMSSFDIKPGGAPWDPNAWIIKEAFQAKWGFLFTQQME